MMVIQLCECSFYGLAVYWISVTGVGGIGDKYIFSKSPQSGFFQAADAAEVTMNFTVDNVTAHPDEGFLVARNNTHNSSGFEEPYLYLEHHFGWMVVTALVIGLAAVVGTLGNILIILAVCCVRTLRTCGNIFVVNLSLADMIVTVFIDPMNVVGAVAGRRVLMEDPVLCEWVASFCAPACMSSMWNMCAISLNRYVLICKPHLYPTIYTVKSSIACCLFIWLLAHLLCMPNHIGWGQNRFNQEYYLCSFDMVTHTYGIFYIMTGVIIPLVGVLFGYTAIFLKVRSVKMQIRQHQKSLATKTTTTETTTGVNDAAAEVKKKRPQKPGFTVDDVKLAKTLFAAFLVFLICWLPFALFVLAHEPDAIPRWIYVIAIIMAHGNSAVNPILYGMTNEKFREGYRTILGLNRRVEDGKSARRDQTFGHGMLPDATSMGASTRVGRTSVDSRKDSRV
ncbi:putative Melatonin receptor type 1A [Hypsibius exemplaris]|uniref:Melatonin receptor type 1A n=1 Tax=Hypsibius exemplaris TaxID=2072580 RepID=A0A9X6RLD9_HYPEX|nr:putative Melatonin receptor type 1A [Hypsibius exemplaris]